MVTTENINNFNNKSVPPNLSLTDKTVFPLNQLKPMDERKD